MSDLHIAPEALAEAQRRIREEARAAAEADAPFLRAAAVLARFNPDRLHPYPTDAAAPGWNRFFAHCAPAPADDEGNWWTLRPNARRRTLAELGSAAEMARALDANPDRPPGLTQRYLDALIALAADGSGSFDDRDLRQREHLAAFAEAAGWLEHVLPDAAEAIELARAWLAALDLLAPLERLVGDAIVGRDPELERLARYVAGPTPAAPLMVTGPGGIGKSAVLAQFLLDHARPEEAAQPGGAERLLPPLVYLDLDRARLDLGDASFLLVEAASQLERLTVDDDTHGLFEDLQFRLEGGAASLETHEYSKSGSRVDLPARLGDAIARLGVPVPFVVDTFEEAQFLGQEVAHNVWATLDDVRRFAPNLRVILAGRVPAETFPTTPLELEGLAPPHARRLVLTQLEGAPGEAPTEALDAFADAVVDAVGGNPLSLRMAAQIAAAEGLEALDALGTRAQLLRRVTDEALQARLYGRILSHIHDPRVQRLAYPGLLVRRLDADVIREVLAEPCGLALDDPADADDLVARLAREVALVEPDASGGLRHRQDVRRIMLKDLASTVRPPVRAAIHDRAVAYYHARPGPAARAEELYHRLMRGDDPAAVADRWEDAAAPFLAGALEELPLPARLWLSQRLGVTPDAAVLARADAHAQEAFIARRVERYLVGGNFEEALAALGEAPERAPASPLFRLESEALRGLGRYEEAHALLTRALVDARATPHNDRLRALLLQAAQVSEALDWLPEALDYAEEAYEGLDAAAPPADVLRVLVLNARLRRKLGDEHDDARRALIDEISQTAEEVSLRSHPALLREVAAELGHLRPEILETAMGTLGVHVESEDEAVSLADALSDWDERLRAPDANRSELAERAGLGEGSREEWKAYVDEIRGSDVTAGETLRRWRLDLPDDALIDKAIVKTYRQAVDTSLKGGLHTFHGRLRLDDGSAGDW